MHLIHAVPFLSYFLTHQYVPHSQGERSFRLKDMLLLATQLCQIAEVLQAPWCWYILCRADHRKGQGVSLTLPPKNYAYGSRFGVFCCDLGTRPFYPYPSGLFHWHQGELTFTPMPVKHMDNRLATKNHNTIATKQSTTNLCASSMGSTVHESHTCQGFPVYFREPHWKSMGLTEIYRETWQVWIMGAFCWVEYTALITCMVLLVSTTLAPARWLKSFMLMLQ